MKKYSALVFNNCKSPIILISYYNTTCISLLEASKTHTDYFIVNNI